MQVGVYFHANEAEDAPEFRGVALGQGLQCIPLHVCLLTPPLRGGFFCFLFCS